VRMPSCLAKKVVRFMPRHSRLARRSLRKPVWPSAGSAQPVPVRALVLQIEATRVRARFWASTACAAARAVARGSL